MKVDGRTSYFEWINAARYVCGNDRGTMTLVSQGLMKQVHFGFDENRLLIRVDAEGGNARERLAEVDRLRIGFVDPAEWEVVVENPATPRPTAYIAHAGTPSSNGKTVEVAVDRILELAVPFRRLDVSPNDPLRFYVELLSAETSLDLRSPRRDLRIECPLARLRAYYVAGLTCGLDGTQTALMIPGRRRYVLECR